MSERLGGNVFPTIRFHHLRLWADVFRKYSETFGEIKPWEIAALDSGKLGDFVRDFSREFTEGEINAKHYLEELSLTERWSKKDLAYMQDVIGTTQNQFDEVDFKRTVSFGRIVDFVSQSKDNLILLTTEPDDFCMSCAVGRHCNRNALQKIVRDDKDFMYMRALRRLIKGRQLTSFYNRGLIGQLGRDTMFIKAEVLFDPDFHKALSDEIVRVYKEAWMPG